MYIIYNILVLFKCIKSLNLMCFFPGTVNIKKEVRVMNEKEILNMLNIARQKGNTKELMRLSKIRELHGLSPGSDAGKRQFSSPRTF